jgi:hypothetical protein
MAVLAAAGLLGAGLLGACNPFSGFAPTETELLTAGPVKRDNYPPGPPVYCYRTLAEVDCYREPQQAEASRLVAGDPPLE